MGKHHEHVVWQNKDGKWGIGFYSQTRLGSEADGYDPEWDVEYDYEAFEFASTGHSTMEAAERTWDGPNPDGPTIYTYSRDRAKQIADFERMALWLKNPELRKAAEKREEAKKVKEHNQKLRELFEQNNDFKGRNVNVVVKSDNKGYTRLGVSYSVTGTVRQEGDWLVVDTSDRKAAKVKLKNTVTGRFNRNLNSIERYNYGYGRSRW